MGKCVDLLKRLKECIVPKDAEIQVAAFNILALCGMLVSSFVASYNLFVGFRVQAFFECLIGVLISYALIIYTKKLVASVKEKLMIEKRGDIRKYLI